jgi:hypothetical protein
MKSFLSTADDVVNSDLPALGGILLTFLKGYEGLKPPYYNNGSFSRDWCLTMREQIDAGTDQPSYAPEYGDRQAEVKRRLHEAWNWLERQGLLMNDPVQHQAGWFMITREGEEWLQRNALFEQLEGLGLDRVKNELSKERPRIGTVGGGAKEKGWIWDWVRRKESEGKATESKKRPGEGLTLIAESRLDERRKLASAKFDLRKLVRMCEELNIVSREECHFATAMLTRGLLDHIPPLFGQTSFKEVANNYGGAGKSFKDTMELLEKGARKVADAHLHMPIREGETLPVAQQVNFASQLDVLLSEIVRITT